MKYVDSKEIVQVTSSNNRDLNAVVASATQTINFVKLTKLEAKLILILYRGKATEPLKAINRAEKEYSSTNIDPASTVYHYLYKQVKEIKDADGSTAAAA